MGKEGPQYMGARGQAPAAGQHRVLGGGGEEEAGGGCWAWLQKPGDPLP